MFVVKDNIVSLYNKKPEMALEYLKRATGLDFDQEPQNLANLVGVAQRSNQKVSRFANYENDLPVVADIVALQVFAH